MMRIPKTEFLLIIVVFLVSACLAGPDETDQETIPITALATLKVVDELGNPLLNYNLQITSGTNDQQFTDASGIAVLAANLNGDNPMANNQGAGFGFMDTFVYFPLTGDTDFSTNPILAPWSVNQTNNWCYNNLDALAQPTGGFIRVYKSSDAATLFQAPDLLTVSITIFNSSDDTVAGGGPVDIGNDLATPATAGLPYIDIWNEAAATGDSIGHKNSDVTVFSITDGSKYAVARVDLNTAVHTVGLAPCGASSGAILSIDYF